VKVGYDGISRVTYNAAARNCYAPVPDVEFRRAPRVPVDRLLRGALRRYTDAVYLPARRYDVDVVHLFNKVSVGRKPWGVTFESFLPRFVRVPGADAAMRLTRPLLLSHRCKFIIAMSEFAREYFLASLSSDQRRSLAPKLHQVYPYQDAPSVEPISFAGENSTLRMCFVGAEFFRKGGEALLEFVEAYGDEADVHLTIISEARGADYATSHLSVEHVKSVRSRLSSNSRIDWQQRIPNEDILEVMRSSHLGVLPTLADTFGYSLLEAMSRGLPIVGTNIQAGSEIVSPEVGWMIELETDPGGYWKDLDRGMESYRAALDILVAGLTRAVDEIRRRPEVVHEKSVRALRRIKQRFNLERTEKMSRILGELAP
jgi:glycosyltransferase involved in cell wall biosynthesis